jgi:hypothetical protein
MVTNNMMSLTTEQFSRIVREQFEDEDYSPILGLGKAGVGKSALLEDIAVNQLKVGYKTLRLVDKTELDLIGLPEIENIKKSKLFGKDLDSDSEVRVTTYATNSLLPFVERDGESGILVIDEITSASSTVQATIYQLLDKDRSIGNYKLPTKWKVVLIGNSEDDGGTYQSITPALLNRCSAGYRIEPDVESWKTWALNHGIHSTVIAFITHDASKLHTLNADADSAELFASPRSWTLLSARLVKREQAAGKLLDEFSVATYAAGAVGQTVGTQFATFYAYSNQMESPETILNGKANPKNMAGRKQETVYITIEGVIKLLNDRINAGYNPTTGLTLENKKQIANAVNWFIGLGDIRLDWAVLGIRDLSQCEQIGSALLLDPELCAMCTSLEDFSNAHKEVWG